MSTHAHTFTSQRIVTKAIMVLFALVTALPLHIGLTTTLSRDQSKGDIRQRITDASI